MYKFIQITHDELLTIYNNYKWSLVWTIIEPQYIDGCEKILNSNDQLVALIYYDINSTPKQICKFEVLHDFRNQGIGQAIIKEFLDFHKQAFELIPFGEDAQHFWEMCGFEGDKYLLNYFPDIT